MNDKIKYIARTVALVYLVIFLGSKIPLSFGFLNPFKKGISDYESTDLIFCKFKKEIDFDDRIVIINVAVPDRQKIADGIEIIQKAVPKSIGVDVIFENRKDSVPDAHLAKTLAKYNNLVLADVLSGDVNGSLPNLCDTLFCNQRNTAYANFVAKPNHSIRFFSPKQNNAKKEILSFTSLLVKKTDAKAYSKLMKRGNDVERIHYRGSEQSYVHIELEDILKGIDFTSAIEGRIVLMGYSEQEDWKKSTRDKFFTPLNRKMALKSLPDMFGVAVHANIISMILDGNFITESSNIVNHVITFLLIVLMVTLLRHLYYKINPGYWKVIRIVQLIVFFLLFIISTLCFYYFHYKIDMTIALVGVVLSWDVLKVHEGVFVKKQNFFQNKEV